MNKRFTLTTLALLTLSTATAIGAIQAPITAAKAPVNKTVINITNEKQAINYLAKNLRKSGTDKGQLAYIPLEHTKKGFQIWIVDRNIQKNGGSGTLGIATISSNGKITY